MKENWTIIAGKLLGKAHYVRNVGLAPDNIITHVYPLEGNEAAIGFDFRTRPEQFKTVMFAKELQSVYVAGPVELVQGGTAIIARYPIFSDYPTKGNYWGSVSVVMNYEKILDDSGLSTFEGAEISLRKQRLDGSIGDVFYGKASIFDDSDMEFPINLPSGKLLLAANFQLRNIEHIQFTEAVVRSLGGFVALICYFSVALLYRNYKSAHKDSLHDELTRIPNRRFIITLLERLMAPADNKQPFALLYIDLNGFKLVNDNLGHEAGDELLKYVANRLVDTVRASDTVSRFGGDEFMVVLRGVTKQEQVRKIVKHIYQSVESDPLIWYDNKIQPSLSIGYSLYHGQDISIQQLFASADKYMYEQKKRFKDLTK
ncbi:diguanylate cyclase domain-containing protein [Photobacterium proteolyticum]|uniref:diguanylate cyclase domain-containing protein n=1 Tax=Photobacterium proteolyticum TaxID=1903952 RepID=UPI0009FA0E56|nr:diguanylate cyclase [Photobacterium proteolyticum]